VPKIGEAGAPSPGRKKGQVNKTTALLKDAILRAAEAAGGKGGTVAYLTDQATDNPAAFMGLLGKVLPLQISGEDGGPVRVGVVEWHVVRPEAKT
jgi:hypothetical protein